MFLSFYHSMNKKAPTRSRPHLGIVTDLEMGKDGNPVAEHPCGGTDGPAWEVSSYKRDQVPAGRAGTG